MAYNQRGSELLSEDECKKIAGIGGCIGANGSPRHSKGRARPTSYRSTSRTTRQHDTDQARTAGFAAHHLDGANVTFEIDDAEPYGRKGWSRYGRRSYHPQDL